MTGRELIRNVMDKENVSNGDMAQRLGITLPALWERLNNKRVKDIPLSTFVDMLAKLNYDVLVVPRGKGAKIEGSLKVTLKENE